MGGGAGLTPGDWDTFPASDAVVGPHHPHLVIVKREATLAWDEGVGFGGEAE
jgi:hypothetical protein